MSYLTFNNGAAPATPAAGKCTLFVATDGRIAKIDEKGSISYLGDQDLNNYLHNSGFWFAQRQTPGTPAAYSSTAGRAISGDRWGITNENASVNYSRTDTGTTPETGLQSKYYGNFNKITSTGKFMVTQVVEARDSQSLRGRTVRVQFWMKASSSKTIRLGLIQLANAAADDTVPATFISAHGAGGTDPTLGTNLAYIAPKSGVTPDNCTVSGNACNCSVTTSWQRFGAVFDVPSNVRNLIPAVWTDGQFTATTDTLSLAQASLTDGYEIQDWSPCDISEELRNCQRYYCKSFDTDTAPAQNAGLAGAVRGYVSVAGATANQPIGVRFPVQMRAAPGTFVFYNPSAANAFARNTTAGTDATATASSTPAGSGTDVFFTGIAAWTVAQAVAVHYTADAEI